MRSDTMKKGLERAPHRSLFKALGLTDREIERPMIGIANSANEIIPGHLHLHQISEAVKAGIRMAGGTPIEFFTIGVCDGIVMGHEGMKYSLSSRELIADSVESMVMAHPFDGLVLIPNCDKIIPGMLMAAARLDIPTIVISGGPMLSGEFQGKKIDLIKVFEYVGKAKVGEMTMDELREAEGCACPGVGSCAGMFTANSMNCLTEVLGMGLPGNGTIPAVWAERIRLAKEAGMQIMELVEKDLRPSDDPDGRGLCQRDHRGHGLRRLDQHLAPPAGDRQGGGRPADARDVQCLQRQDPAPLLHVARRTPRPRRSPPGGRHPRPHAGALPRRPDQNGGANGHGQNGRREPGGEEGAQPRGDPPPGETVPCDGRPRRPLREPGPGRRRRQAFRRGR